MISIELGKKGNGQWKKSRNSHRHFPVSHESKMAFVLILFLTLFNFSYACTERKKLNFLCLRYFIETMIIIRFAG